MNKNIYLVEKRSSLNKHRPSLALARFSTLHKNNLDNIIHVIIDSHYSLPVVPPDKVYISIIFSWDLPYFVKFISKLRRLYPFLTNEDIVIGGVATYHVRQQIIEQTGITPSVGCLYDLDHVIPDPAFYEEDNTYLFTMRSCPNRCSFCIVNSIESDFYVIKNYKEQINDKAGNVVICDNNLLAAPLEHWKEVLSYLTEIAHKDGVRIQGTRKLRTVEFDGGFDWRHLKDENIELLKDIRFSKIRVAFDDVRYEKGFDQSIERLLKAFPKVSKRGMHENIECYVLYGCDLTKDTLEDTLYRVYKLYHHYKIWPYLIRFQPLDNLTYKTYVSPFWTSEDLVDIARWANSRRVLAKTPNYKFYYGRQEDGKCLSHFQGDQSLFVSGHSFEIPILNYDLGYQANFEILKRDLRERNESHKRNQRQVTQMRLAI